MLGVIYDYIARLLLFVFIVKTYESTEHSTEKCVSHYAAVDTEYNLSEVVSWKLCKLLVWMHIFYIMHEGSNM